MADNYDALRNSIDDILASANEENDARLKDFSANLARFGEQPVGPQAQSNQDRLIDIIRDAARPTITLSPEQIAARDATLQNFRDNYPRNSEQPISRADQTSQDVNNLQSSGSELHSLASSYRSLTISDAESVLVQQYIAELRSNNPDISIEEIRAAVVAEDGGVHPNVFAHANQNSQAVQDIIDLNMEPTPNFNSVRSTAPQPISPDSYLDYAGLLSQDRIDVTPHFAIPQIISLDTTIPPELVSADAIDIAPPLEPVRSFEDRLMSALDVNADGAVNINDQLDAANSLNNTLSSREVLNEMVDVLDADNNGIVSQGEISSAADTLGIEDRALVNLLSVQMQQAGLVLNATGEGSSHTVGDLQVAMVNFTPQQDNGAEVGRA